MVEFGFEKGGVGALHSHPHVQSSYVAEGRFEVTIDGKTEIVEAGGAFIVPSNLVHGVKALEAGRLVDTFTPHRADFLVADDVENDPARLSDKTLTTLPSSVAVPGL